ncbi:leucine-rich repeat-containing protein 27 isoform 2-T2 [Porphyrio hochstetteri]
MDDSYSTELNSSGDSFGEHHLRKGNSSRSNSPGEIRTAVEECLLSSSNTLDISRRNIKHLTEEIYRLPNIKYFHLEGNVISTIPEDLFQKLPHLVWLDLRYNKIKALPSGIGYHRQLKTLLLERNPIKELPPELGEMPPVEKLNLSDLLQPGLDLSEEWPNEEEKQRFQKLKEEMIKQEKEEFLAYKRVGATHNSAEAGKSRERAKIRTRSQGAWVGD